MASDGGMARLLVLMATAAGCAGGLGGLEDDEWCAVVDAADECPTAKAADTQWAGTSTCETPVREIVEITAFIERRDEATGWYDTATDSDSCCYEVRVNVRKGEGCAVGRPLTAEGPQVAALRFGSSDWSADLRPAAAELPAGTRRRLAAHWRRAGLLEHASVASFARFALDLMVLGAPAELVAAAHLAALDEVRHAQQSLALAAAYGESMSPGPLLAAGQPSGVTTLARLAAATFTEGCVGETLAAALAAHQRDVATDPAVCAVLTGIADDEARHAALAWRAVRWAIDAGGDEVRAAVAQAWSATTPPASSDHTVDPLAEAHGWSSGADEAAVARRALAAVVAPALAVLLA